jgi:hypothetical protein
MVLGYIYSAITRLFYGDTDSKIDTENNDLTSSCIIGKSLTPNVMAPLPKNIVLTNVKN